MGKLQFIEVVYQDYQDEENGQLFFAQKNKYFTMDEYDDAKEFYDKAMADIAQHLTQDEGGLWGTTDYNGRRLEEYYADFVHKVGENTEYLPVTLKVVELVPMKRWTIAYKGVDYAVRTLDIRSIPSWEDECYANVNVADRALARAFGEEPWDAEATAIDEKMFFYIEHIERLDGDLIMRILEANL